MKPGDFPVFPHVVGGELPLSAEEARCWLDHPEAVDGDKNAVIEKVCELYGGTAEAAFWFAFGRSALGVGLQLSGAGKDGSVALPSYQCEVVYAAARTRCDSVLTYQLNADLSPDEESLLSTAGMAKAVVTCPYFGSSFLDERLNETGARLLALPNQPWVIEDRAMAFPMPVAGDEAAQRCDFIAYSLRKSYPVPDGAPLVACSARAREALGRWREEADTVPGDDLRHAIRVKVDSKVKRNDWLSCRPIVDDPELNGLRESEKSDALISAVEAETTNGAGSAASAAYMLGRDLKRDLMAVRGRAEAIVAGVRDMARTELPLRDCVGIAVPLLRDDRDVFRGALREQGIFLPAHWPRDGNVPVNGNVAQWYGAEVSLPTPPAGPPEDIEYLIRRLAAL